MLMTKIYFAEQPAYVTARMWRSNEDAGVQVSETLWREFNLKSQYLIK